MRFLLALLAVIFIMTTTVSAEERLPTISVNGEGIVETSPDRAKISIGVVSREKDPAKVQSENARIASDIIKNITALGVEKKNIRTGNYSFNQFYRNDSNHNRVFEGYEVTNTVTVIVDNLNLIGKVIDSSLSGGANRIESLEFGIKNKSSLQSEALKLAVRDAFAKAEIVAAELGKSIVGVRNVSINGGGISAPRFSKMAMEDRVANFETPIETGTLNCTASVHIDFEISEGLEKKLSHKKTSTIQITFEDREKAMCAINEYVNQENEFVCVQKKNSTGKWFFEKNPKTECFKFHNGNVLIKANNLKNFLKKECGFPSANAIIKDFAESGILDCSVASARNNARPYQKLVTIGEDRIWGFYFPAKSFESEALTDRNNV